MFIFQSSHLLRKNHQKESKYAFLNSANTHTQSNLISSKCLLSLLYFEVLFKEC